MRSLFRLLAADPCRLHEIVAAQGELSAKKAS
jgi:hypothetical protein